MKTNELKLVFDKAKEVVKQEEGKYFSQTYLNFISMLKNNQPKTVKDDTERKSGRVSV